MFIILDQINENFFNNNPAEKIFKKNILDYSKEFLPKAKKYANEVLFNETADRTALSLLFQSKNYILIPHHNRSMLFSFIKEDPTKTLSITVRHNPFDLKNINTNKSQYFNNSSQIFVKLPLPKERGF